MHRLIELLTALGRSLLACLEAEIGALAADLKASGVAFGKAVVLLLLALGFLVLGVGFVLLSAAVGLRTVVPVWATLLISGVGILLVAAVSALRARSGLRRIEPPAATVSRRVENQQRWWSENIVPPSSDIAENEE